VAHGKVWHALKKRWKILDEVGEDQGQVFGCGTGLQDDLCSGFHYLKGWLLQMTARGCSSYSVRTWRLYFSKLKGSSLSDKNNQQGQRIEVVESAQDNLVGC